MSIIRRLPETLINQIAAGEVIERPFSVVKELVENSFDAGAQNVVVTLEQAGKSSIIVEDDGSGMGKDDMTLALERHATSKLPDDNLWGVKSLGFRGEALPSIAAISRMKIASRCAGDEHGWQMKIEGGKIVQDPAPIAMSVGTKIEIHDLFYAVPARLKFLKSDAREILQIKDTLKHLALAFPARGLTLWQDGKKSWSVSSLGLIEDALPQRIAEILGSEFTDNALMIDREKEGVRLYGMIGLPTMHRANSYDQYWHVNQRPVKDRILSIAARLAYQDVLMRGRHPLYALFLDVPPDEVDVNVHPAKAEIRFRQQELIRGFIISTLRGAIQGGAQKSAGQITADQLEKFQLEKFTPRPIISGASPARGGQGSFGMREDMRRLPGFAPMAMPSARENRVAGEAAHEDAGYLGAAKAHLHQNYILAQNEKGLVIIDQHAAHERIVYERLKKQILGKEIAKQVLLIPEVVEIENEKKDLLLAHQNLLADLGLVIDEFGEDAILVRETPAILGQFAVKKLLQDLVEELVVGEEGNILEEKLDALCSRMACHGSVRSGRILNHEEMNALMRQMEETESSGQCNHGRPTYVELPLDEIEKLFGRK